MSTVADGAAGPPSHAWSPESSPRQVGAAPLSTVMPTLESVHRDHFGFICRSLRGLGVPAEAIDDAAQETLFVIHRRLPEYEPRAPLRAWLFRIVTHVARNFRRSAQRRQRREAEGEALVQPASGPEAAVAGREALRLTERFLAGLDEGKRAVFILALIEQLPAPEVATTLGVPVNTVYSRVRALREGFRALLAKEYEESLR